ncbi:CHAD domain-containing protein [Neorhizobium alkalisoli]|uniref:CHAD domain-containing protein n=1 Tax=Neorhizobium alkalisoli TaxID=528178 RepID=A0A561QNS5_9HYPH|nr:CHAD domain-containing protein [Neorhizobium alkalisoli]TWF52028.1 CHAD domain-containing protein [Neorhizobium alkalisoli]
MAFRLRPDRPFTAEFRSVAENQLKKAIGFLENQPDGPHEAIHDARKKFKRVRALYRLIEPDAKDFRRAENARLRDMAKTLSAVRDATALIETVDYLTTEAGSEEEQAALASASNALTKRRDRIAAEEHDLPAKMAAAADTCRAAIAALDGLELDDHHRRTAKRLGKVWEKQRRKAIAALSQCHDNTHAEAFHDLRKCGQVYWMHLSLLRDAWPSAMAAKQRETKLLVDRLGHEHDLSVLTEIINESPDIFGSSETLALVIGAIITRQQALRHEALDLAEKVFADSAERESDVIALLWLEASRLSGKVHAEKPSDKHIQGQEIALRGVS